jgi:thymidylate synthase (FAD)
MCEIKFHIKLPIFIARQWIRHRTANVNEYSARYSILDKEFYIPDISHMKAQSTSNRQGSGETLPPEQAQEVMRLLREDSERVYEHYQSFMNQDEKGDILDPEKSGLARELARMNLTLNYYTQWYWKIDLQNLMHFLSLRADSHAQYEIRVYAEVMLDILKRWLPLTHAAFMNYRIGGMSLSSKGIDIVKRIINGEQVTQENSGLSAGEWREMMKNFM